MGEIKRITNIGREQMNLRELKNLIRENKIVSSLLIFVGEEPFINQEYVHAISKINNKEVKIVENLSDVVSARRNIFDTTANDYTYVYESDKLDRLPFDENDLHDVVIVCKTIDDTIRDKYSSCVVDIPKLEKWQIEDYAKTICDGVSEDKLKWICEISNYNVFRIKSEIDKLNVFLKGDREHVFNLMNDEDGYSDLSSLNIFDLTNAIMKKDIKSIGEVVENIKNIDVEPTGLVTILKNQFYYLLNVQINRNVTAKELNISEGRLKAIKYNCGKYSNQHLVDSYKMLCNIDYKLKSGLIDEKEIIDYVITHIVGE